MYLPSEEPIEPRPEQPPPIFIDELVFELTQAVADLTSLATYLAATKTLPPTEAAALKRLHSLVEKL
jgi:hypothetical protein